MTLQWLLGWWNLIYIVPFFLAMLYLVTYTVSGWTFGDADADVDVHAEFGAAADGDADADVHADVEAHADVNAEAGHDVGHDAEQDHDAEAGGHGSPAMAALTWIGVGRVPLSIVLMVLLLCWGVIGFSVNQVLRPTMGELWMVSVVSLPAAFFGSILCSRLIAAAMSRFLPTNETYAHRRHELLGSVGTAILAIDHHFGLAAVHDQPGTLFQVPCRTEDPAGRIEKDSQVLLVGYSAKEGVFHVIPATASGPRAA